MDSSDEFILVGKVSGVFGVKGWMKVFSFTDPRQNILNYSPIYISQKGKWVEVKVLDGRMQGKGVVISLDKVTDPDHVLPLIGAELAIKATQLVKPAENEFYWSELIGLTVVNLNNDVFGQVDSLCETGAHDVLLVKDKQQKTERLIPFVLGEIVKSVDLEKEIIHVDWEMDYLR